MNDFINILSHQLLNEAQLSEIPNKIQVLLSKLAYHEPFVYRLFSRTHTDYIADSSIQTAGVTVSLNRIKFYYNPEFINKLSLAELNFLLQHEIYHILRRHGARGAGIGATSQSLHFLHNIAADAFINADCIKDGGFGGLPMKVIEGAWFVKAPSDKYNSVNKEFGKNEKDVYKGLLNSESLYKWMKERYKNFENKQQSNQSKSGQQQSGQSKSSQQSQKWSPKVGDVVYNKKTNQYGRVISINGKNIQVESITEQEASDILKNKK